MKKIILFVCIASLCNAAFAQQYDVMTKVAEDWRKICAMEGPHRFDSVSIAKAPKGYKAFYITHYGRHGSRNAWNVETYKLLHQVFIEAHNEGKLTSVGEDFRAKYEDYYFIPYLNTGDIVPLGFEQHKRIGEIVYDAFPEVFKGAKKVNAVTSTSQRSIVSMSSFCLSLQAKNPSLDIFQSCDHTGMKVIAPVSAPAEIRRNYIAPSDQPTLESVADFTARTVDYKGILERLFTDPAFVEKYQGGSTRFCSELFSFLGNYHNSSEEPIFDGTVTVDQLLTLWEANNYRSFYGDITSRYNQIPLLEDIITKAEEAFVNPGIAADLRFGHDYVMEAFTCLLDMNSSGTVPQDASEAKYWFQSYNTPMANTVLFAFYRNKQNDIIFQLIWNEATASLPQLVPVYEGFYRWDDFKEWAEALIASHPAQQ